MQRATNAPHSNSLAQVVCAWSPCNLVQLANQYSDACAPPTVSFPSYDKYKAYFEPLLLAEVSAELVSVTEKFQRSVAPRHAKVRARREEAGASVALVAVQKVTRVHNYGFGWVVDLESHDRKGPVGSIENDVVAVWPSQVNDTRGNDRQGMAASARAAQSQRIIPGNSVLGVIVRTSRGGCRVILSKFPDGNEEGVRTDLEEGEESEQIASALRVWNCLRLSSLTTMRREFEALQKIKTSVLLPTLLRPNIQSIPGNQASLPGNGPDAVGGDRKMNAVTDSASAASHSLHRNQETFTSVITRKTGMNPSQSKAIYYASTCRSGFAVVQGPPGTGKTRTLISLLNVIHMAQYQEYYEGLLASLEPLHGTSQDKDATKMGTDSNESRKLTAQKGTSGSLLENMMMSMNKKVSSSTDIKQNQTITRARRPRLLICAPSNSAVDEVLTRLTKAKFIDGQGRPYCPELARIGAGDRVSEAAKQFTAEGQAEAFLDRLCAEDMSPEARKNAQMSFMATWQGRCNSLLVQLERVPKKQPSSRTVIVDLHEKLERMDRDLRRLSIAASDGPKSHTREEKLRQIARTYVEDAQLVFATLSGSASSILTQKASNDVTGALFDTVVIDEGAQATETSCLIPMALGASRCILVGDPQQLPATVLSSGAAGLAYGQSLLERVCRGGQSVQLLDTQYRMHPAISSFPRRYFYNGRLVDDESVQGENRARPYHRDAIRPKLGPYVFLDIAEGEERRSKDDRSIFNRTEAELASLIYTKLKKEYSCDTLFSPAAKAHGSVSGFGVVTPYKRQMQELRQSFDRAGIPTGDVEIDTVDSFQGREKDVIVFSCVRTASVHSGIGFVRDVRRMNVGLTRARVSLIVLGSAQALSEGSSDWAELVEDANSRGCLISVSNIARCLNPSPMGASPTLPDSDPKKETVIVSSSLTPHVVTEVIKTSGANHAEHALRKSHNAVPSDPRRRIVRRESPLEVNPTVPTSNQTQFSNGVSKTGSSGQSLSVPRDSPAEIRVQKAVPSNAPHLTHAQEIVESQNYAMSSFQRTVPQATASDLKSRELQATLEQMSQELRKAGLKNSKHVEETLKEHMRSGGALDVETVLAAIISTSDGTPKRSSPGPAAVSVLNGGTSVGTEGSFAQGKDLQSVLQGFDGSMQQSTQNNSQLRPPTETASNVPARVGNVFRSGPGDRKGKAWIRGEKMPGKERSQLKKRERVEKPEPSGWDMLFTAKTESAKHRGGQESSCENSERQSQAPNIKGEPLVQFRNDQMRLLSRTQDPSVTAGSLPQGNVAPRRVSPAVDSGRQHSNNIEQHVTGKSRNDWVDYGGRGNDRKRAREGDQFRGSSARGRTRDDRGRGRGKRERHPMGNMYESQIENSYPNDAWGSAAYDPNFAQYGMMGNGLDPNLVAAHQEMNALQATHHQAVQQYMMQQQALQQQALQQQPQTYQQPNYQMQMMQQQAMQQQEAMHHAAYLQMAGGAGPMTQSPVDPYHQVDMGNYNSGMMSNAALNQRGQSWSHGSGGRSIRGGRGRGRYGRGRRGM